MKKAIIITILSSLFQISSLLAQGNAELTLFSCFKPDNVFTTIYLNLKGSSSVEYWNKDYVKVEIEIKTNIDKKGTIKHLSNMGRFAVDFSEELFSTIISMPNLQKSISVNGMEYIDEMTFKIYAPMGVEFNDLNTESRSLAANK